MDGYKDFKATSLFCPRCKQAMPVREHLFIILPDGDKFEYRCARCATSLGFRMVPRTAGFNDLIHTPARRKA